MPYPLDKVLIVNVSEVRRADIGMSLPEHVHQPNEEPESIQLLTGDENIITTQAIVHYKISDAAKFLYSVNGNSEQLVRYSVESALVRMMANTAVDDIRPGAAAPGRFFRPGRGRRPPAACGGGG